MGIEAYLTRAADAPVDAFDWGSIAWLDGGGVTAGTGLSCALVTIEAGARNDRHRHPNCEEALYLLAGALDHALGDESVPLAPGDLLHVPRGEPHHAESVGEEDAVMLVVYDADDREVEVLE